MTPGATSCGRFCCLGRAACAAWPGLLWLISPLFYNPLKAVGWPICRVLCHFPANWRALLFAGRSATAPLPSHLAAATSAAWSKTKHGDDSPNTTLRLVWRESCYGVDRTATTSYETRRISKDGSSPCFCLHIRAPSSPPDKQPANHDRRRLPLVAHSPTKTAPRTFFRRSLRQSATLHNAAPQRRSGQKEARRIATHQTSPLANFA